MLVRMVSGVRKGSSTPRLGRSGRRVSLLKFPKLNLASVSLSSQYNLEKGLGSIQRTFAAIKELESCKWTFSFVVWDIRNDPYWMYWNCLEMRKSVLSAQPNTSEYPRTSIPCSMRNVLSYTLHIHIVIFTFFMFGTEMMVSPLLPKLYTFNHDDDLANLAPFLSDHISIAAQIGDIHGFDEGILAAFGDGRCDIDISRDDQLVEHRLDAHVLEDPCLLF